MIVGYWTLWIFVSGFYNTLQVTDSIGDAIAYTWLVGLIGIILRYFSIENPKGRMLVVGNDICILIILRGILGISVHFMLPSELHRILTDPLMYGGIFIIVGALGAFIFNKVRKVKST